MAWLGPRLFAFGICLFALGGCSGDHPPMFDESPQRGGGGDNGGPPPVAHTPTASSGGGCTPSKDDANADVVTVHGSYNGLGSVDYTIRGFSVRYVESKSGVRRETTGAPSNGESPEIDLAMFADEETAETGRTYSGNNKSPRSGPYIQVSFDLLGSSESVQDCPTGEGKGNFIFTRFLEDDVAASGTYAFSCPDRDIDVRGCFRYVR